MHAVNTSAVRLTLQGGGEGHRFGINAIATSGESLLTAGRDGTVRSWSVHAGAANLEHTLDEHSDWVNGIAVLRPGSFVTCSSDPPSRDERRCTPSRPWLRACVEALT